MSMRRALFLVFLFAATAHAAISGRAIDPDGKPLAGVRVRAFALETEVALHARLLSATPERTALSEVETKNDGAFTIDAKGNGVVTLLLEASDREWRSIDAVDGEDAGAFVLRPAKKVRGRVVAGGKGVANALVVINADVVARTDAEGAFEIGLQSTEEAGRFFVIHPDYAPFESYEPRGRKSLGDIELQSGRAITGRVLAPDGKTIVSGAAIRAGLWPLATSGEDGAFRIAHLASQQNLVASDATRIGRVDVDKKKNAYDIVLRPGATVTGTARSAKDERPIGGARVMIADRNDRSTFTAITDARGNFTIAPLPAMSTSVGMTHPAYALNDSAPADLTEGTRVAKNLSAMPLARLRGIVVDDQRRPVAAARVGVGVRITSATTGPDGTFMLRVPRVSQPQNVVVTKRGYANATEGPIALPPGETKSVEITLRKGFSFEVTLLDENGKPVAGEPLIVYRWTDPNDRQSFVPMVCNEGDAVACSVSDENGRRSYDISEGKYDIYAGGKNTVRETRSAQMIDAKTAPLTLRMQRGVAIEGRVLDADEQPVENASISGAAGAAGIMSARTDASGAFALRSLASGRSLTITATSPSGVAGEPVTVAAPARDVVLHLPRPARLEGRVYDRDSKQPVREFTVGIVRERRGRDNTRNFKSDDGRFVIEEITPGEVDIAVQAKGYAAGGIVDVKATAGGTTTVEVALDRGGIVKGRVTSNGQPLGDVNVFVVSQGSMTRTLGAPAPVRTDASGEFTLDSIATGTQRIDFRRQGWVSATKTVDVTGGQETRVDVELARGRDVQGRVVDEAGRPIANAEVRMDASTPTVRTDVEGAFKFEGLGDATYTITARKDGYTNAERKLAPGDTSNITLTLGRGASISGRVIGVSGGDLANVEVSASGDRMWRASAQPDASGNFTLQGVPDGRISIIATQMRPVSRRSERKQIDVANGSAPFVELDFNAGFAVRGRVTRNGVPVDGMITFGPSRTGPTPRPANGAFGEVRADGTYEVRLTDPGEYEVRVQMAGPARGFGSIHRVTVTGSMTHDFDIKGATLRGRVIDDKTGAPIAGATVNFMAQGYGGPPAITDSDGRFSFDNLGDDKYRIDARRDHYVSEPLEIVINDGVSQDLELRLRQGEAINVRVVDVSTNQALDATIIVRAKGATSPMGVSPPTRTDNGVSRMWLLPGSYTANVSASGYAPRAVDVVVPGPDVQVMLERGGTVVVKHSVAGAVLMRLRSASNRYAVAASRPQFDGVATGVYTLEFLDGQQKVLATRENVSVAAGQTTTVPLP